MYVSVRCVYVGACVKCECACVYVGVRVCMWVRVCVCGCAVSAPLNGTLPVTWRTHSALLEQAKAAGHPSPGCQRRWVPRPFPVLFPVTLAQDLGACSPSLEHWPPRGAGPLQAHRSPQSQGPPNTHLRPEVQAGLGRERLYRVAMDTSSQRGGAVCYQSLQGDPDQGPRCTLAPVLTSLKEQL